jgi:hypothetical protein
MCCDRANPCPPGATCAARDAGAPEQSVHWAPSFDDRNSTADASAKSRPRVLKLVPLIMPPQGPRPAAGDSAMKLRDKLLMQRKTEPGKKDVERISVTDGNVYWKTCRVAAAVLRIRGSNIYLTGIAFLFSAKSPVASATGAADFFSTLCRKEITAAFRFFVPRCFVWPATTFRLTTSCRQLCVMRDAVDPNSGFNTD